MYAKEIDALAQAEWMLVGLGFCSCCCYFPLSCVVCQAEIKIQHAADADMAETQHKMLRALPRRLHAVVHQAVVRAVFGCSVAMLDVFVR